MVRGPLACNWKPFQAAVPRSGFVVVKMPPRRVTATQKPVFGQETPRIWAPGRSTADVVPPGGLP